MRGERGGAFEGEGGRDEGEDAIGNNYGVGIGGLFMIYRYRIAINRDSLQTTATGTALCYCMYHCCRFKRFIHSEDHLLDLAFPCSKVSFFKSCTLYRVFKRPAGFSKVCFPVCIN